MMMNCRKRRTFEVNISCVNIRTCSALLYYMIKLRTNQHLTSLICLSLGNCQAGYYCPMGQTEANPVVFICTPGHYCEEGSGTPTQCPIGTFSNATGNSNVTDCKPCTAGKPSTMTLIVSSVQCMSLYHFYNNMLFAL